MNLYEISARTRHLQSVIEGLTENGAINDAEIASQIDELLNGNEAELKSKVDNYCALIQEKKADAAARKAEVDRLTLLARNDAALADKLIERLKLHFEDHGISKLETARFKVCIVGNGGKKPLFLADDFTPPEGYFRTIIEPEKDLIREAIANGVDIPGAIMGERGTRLSIK